MRKAKAGSTPPPENVTKLEGAERLLKTSIRLFFEEGDMLAIHALVAGAHEVLRTLLSKRNQKGSFIKDNDYIRSEHLSEYLKHMNRTQNFLKHADRDPDEVLDFYQAATPFWIFDSIGMYIKLNGSMKHKAFLLFFAWFAQEHPGLLKQGALADKVNLFKSNSCVTKEHFADLMRNPGLFDSKDYL